MSSSKAILQVPSASIAMLSAASSVGGERRRCARASAALRPAGRSTIAASCSSRPATGADAPTNAGEGFVDAGVRAVTRAAARGPKDGGASDEGGVGVGWATTEDGSSLQGRAWNVRNYHTDRQGINPATPIPPIPNARIIQDSNPSRSASLPPFVSTDTASRALSAQWAGCRASAIAIDPPAGLSAGSDAMADRPSAVAHLPVR